MVLQLFSGAFKERSRFHGVRSTNTYRRRGVTMKSRSTKVFPSSGPQGSLSGTSSPQSTGFKSMRKVSDSQQPLDFLFEIMRDPPGAIDCPSISTVANTPLKKFSSLILASNFHSTGRRDVGGRTVGRDCCQCVSTMTLLVSFLSRVETRPSDSENSCRLASRTPFFAFALHVSRTALSTAGARHVDHQLLYLTGLVEL